MKTNQKDQIMEAALRLFAEKGYGNTSIAAIAREAGVAQGLMYNYFDSKEDLLRGLLEKGFQGVQESMSAYNEPHPPQKAIAMHITATFAHVAGNKDFWRLFHAIKLQDQVQAYINTEYAEAKTFILKTLATNFKKLGYKSPNEESKLFFAMIDGLVVNHLMDPKSFSLNSIKKLILKKYHI